MGSGISGLYSGTYGAAHGLGEGHSAGRTVPANMRKSQPYAQSYGVMPDMLEYDKKRGVYSDSNGYSLNPTVTSAQSSIHNGILVDKAGNPMDGAYTYAVKEDGELVIGKRNGNGRDGKATPHPTLVGGKNPRVRVAGMVTLSHGRVVKYDTESGHYKPNARSIAAADDAFSQLPPTAFHKNFKKDMGRR